MMGHDSSFEHSRRNRISLKLGSMLCRVPSKISADSRVTIARATRLCRMCLSVNSLLPPKTGVSLPRGRASNRTDPLPGYDRRRRMKQSLGGALACASRMATQRFRHDLHQSCGLDHPESGWGDDRDHRAACPVSAQRLNHEGHLASFLLFPSPATGHRLRPHNRPSHLSVRRVLRHPFRRLLPSWVPCLLRAPSCPVHVRRRSCAHTG